MGIKERREREKVELKTLIVNAARERFARYGFDAVSMRQIADDIEYSATAIYLHFKDKHELFREICRQDFHRMAQVFLQVGRIEDPIRRLRKLGLTYVKFGVENPSHYRFMFMTPIDEAAREIDPDEWRNRGNPACDGYATLLQAVEHAIEHHAIRGRRSDVQTIAQTFWAGVHGVASLEVAMRNDPWIDWSTIDRRASTMVDALIVGLGGSLQRGRGVT
jgi:AcrR family transcriptional regulator